jgi:hypothetical protein
MHSALPILKFVPENKTPLVSQPHYGPDLFPVDFFLYSELKVCLKGAEIPDFFKIMYGMW